MVKGKQAETAGIILRAKYYRQDKGKEVRMVGYIIRMPSEKLPKRLTTCHISGRKRRGKPKERWQEEVEDEIQKNAD